MQSTDQKQVDTSIKVNVVLNNPSKTTISACWIPLCERSILFKQMDESSRVENGTTIPLKLERPEKFTVLLHYLETGKMAEELTNSVTFASYVNDVMYLNIPTLEKQFIENMEFVCQSTYDLTDFSKSQPNIDFMEKFLKEKASNMRNSVPQALYVMARWMEKMDLDYEVIQGLITKYLKITDLTWSRFEPIFQKYQKQFDKLIPSSQVAQMFKCYKCRHRFSSRCYGCQ